MMDYGKYIMVLERGHKVPILFGPLISHDTFLKCYHKDLIVSAGFFLVDGDTVLTFGESTTLDIKANSEDSLIIKKSCRGVK